MEQCRKRLDETDNKLFSTDATIDALEITLKHNLTIFNGVMYRQRSGTAMGPPNAPPYADNSVSFIDDLVFSDGDEAPPTQPVIWARYKDDVYMPWIGTLEELYEFVRWLNNINPNIQFTMSTPSTHGTQYLETFVYTDENGLLQTKSYSKPCDTHAYIVPTSCHPTHQLENIPYSIAHKIYRVSSTQQDYETAKAEFTEHLSNRGYHMDLISNAFTKVEGKSRTDLLKGKVTDQVKETSPTDRLFPLVTDFNPALPNISKTLKKYEHILDLDSDASKIVNKSNIFASFRRAPTLQDKLIHSKIHDLPAVTGVDSNHAENLNSAQTNDERMGCYHCENRRCVTCTNYLVETSTFTSYHTESIFKINNYLTCKSLCVVYIVNCKTCSKSCVGCTINFNTRWANHKSHIKHRKRTCEISKHFNDVCCEEVHNLDRSNQKAFDNSLKKCIEVTVIEQVKVDDGDDNEEKLRKCKVREKYWQKQLKCMEITGGMNRREELSITLSNNTYTRVDTA